MDFETVVGLLVFFFYVVPVILKKVRRKKNAGKPPVGKPPKQGLAARFAEKAQLVIKDLEKQAAESRKNKSRAKETGSPWDGLVAADDSKEPEFDYFEPIDEPEEPAPVKAAEPIKPVVPVRPVKRKVPAAGQPLPATVTTAMTPEGLRNAVIWSEILSPPLALRDDG